MAVETSEEILSDIAQSIKAIVSNVGVRPDTMFLPLYGSRQGKRKYKKRLLKKKNPHLLIFGYFRFSALSKPYCITKSLNSSL